MKHWIKTGFGGSGWWIEYGEDENHLYYLSAILTL
jgi:hypothetical protein